MLVENTDMQNTVVLYHQYCNDGFGAAWAFHYLNDANTNATYCAMNYGDKIPACVNTESHVLFLDFSIPLEEMKELIIKVALVTVIDHHKSSLELAIIHGNNFNFIHNLEESGASLTWKSFSSNPMPYFLSLIKDRDLWNFLLPDTKPFHIALDNFSKDFNLWNSLLYRSTVDNLINTGKHMLIAQQDIIKSIADNGTINTILDVPMYFLNCVPILSSDTADYVGKNKTIITCPIVLFYIQGDTVKYSMRGGENNIVDLSMIAKAKGGGGHFNAASFTVKVEESHLMREDF